MGYDPTQPYEQPGQPPYGQPPYGQPGQPSYGQPNQPPYGQSGQPPYGQPPYGQPGQPPYGQPAYGQPGLPPVGVPDYARAPQAQKKSRRGLWIALGIIGGVLVLLCVGFGVAGALGVSLFTSIVSGPTNAVNQYYTAVENQDYQTAYSYLQLDTFTVGGQQVAANEAVYARLASALDTTKGKVTSHSITNIQVNNNDATVVINATRSGQTYEVQLELQKIGNDWKIVRFNNV